MVSVHDGIGDTLKAITSPPPVEDYSAKLNYSLSVLKQRPVHVEERLLSVLGLAIVERLRQLGTFVLVATVVETHVHLLVKMPEHFTRDWTGLAKKHAWFKMRDAGWQKKLWAKRAKFTPVDNRRHLYNSFAYIVRHQERGRLGVDLGRLSGSCNQACLELPLTEAATPRDCNTWALEDFKMSNHSISTVLRSGQLTFVVWRIPQARLIAVRRHELCKHLRVNLVCQE